jgi:hypothetical protein
VEPFSIPVPPLARPTLRDIQKYGVTDIFWDDSPTEAIDLELATVLIDRETHIGRWEYISRVTGLRGLPGLQHGLWIIENQEEPSLAHLRNLRGKIYIDLRGFLARIGASESKRFPYLGGDAGRWGLAWDSTGGFHADIGRLAISRKSNSDS